MIRKKQEQEIMRYERLRGGNGTLRSDVILNAKNGEFYEKGRLFSRMTLKPGCSIGYHVHENEMECYYILKGNPEYDDNGKKAILNPGDLTITPSGEGHAIANPEKAGCDAEFIALILFK